MAHIVEHLSVEELEARYRAAQDATEARHFQAIWLLAEGRTVLEVAEVLAFVPRWVEQLAARYNACGPGALGDQRRRNGRTASLLTPELLAALAERLEWPPEDGGVWSGPRSRPGWRGASGCKGAPAAGLGCPATARLVAAVAAPAAPARGHARAEGGAQKSSLARWRGPGRRIPPARSRFGPRTSAASA